MAGLPVSDGAKRRTEAVTPAGSIKAKTESQTLAVANKIRVVLKVTNDGGKKVYLAYGPTAVKEKGIPLNAEGGSATIDEYTGIVTVVTAAEESVVCFVEV